MQYKLSFLFLLIVGSLNTSFAQLEKTLHQTFSLDDRTTILLDLYGQYTIVPWAGNNVLVETQVKLYNSTGSVLKHFIEKDLRYQIDADTTTSSTLTLVSHDKKRASLRTKTGAESTEVIETRVFVPDSFVVRDEKTLVKAETKE
ncbi:MAG: hypothetical protein MUC59_18105 [Saprospiraceae bacterium]|nr:hypothetical protein [Saprospiraceae bacterium]